MQTININETKPMLFTAGYDWHLDIFIEANAQVSSVSLKAYSKRVPTNIYSINYFGVLQNGNATQYNTPQN